MHERIGSTEGPLRVGALNAKAPVLQPTGTLRDISGSISSVNAQMNESLNFKPRTPVSLLRVAGLLALVALVAVLGLYVWPTPWRYDHVVLNGNTYPVRLHRISGVTEVLLGTRGWTVTDQESSKSVARKDDIVPAEELRKIDGRLSVTDYDWIEADIYNGTARQLGELRVRIIITNPDQSQVLDREYTLSSTGGGALSSSRYIASCGCRPTKVQRFTWQVTHATWRS